MRFALYSIDGGYVGDVPRVLSAVRTRSVDGTDQLELSFLGIDAQKDDRVCVGFPDGSWREYAIVSVSTERGGRMGAAMAVCRNSVCELSRKYILEREGRGYTASAALDKAIEGTRWSRGTVDATGTANVSFYHQSALKSIEEICAAYACELDATVEVSGAAVTRRLVHLRRRIGADTKRRFTYSRDLASVKRTVLADDVVTRLYGWGKGVEVVDADGGPTGGYSRKIGFADVNGGKAYVEDAEATKRFGVPGADGTRQPAEGAYENGDIDDPSELLRLTKEELKVRSRPQVSYECTVAVLARAGEGFDGAACGDTVQIVDTAFDPPLRLEGRILKTVEDLVGDLSRAQITLGNVIDSLTTRSRRAEAAVQKLASSAGAWDGAASLGSSYLEGVIEGVNAVLNETGGYTYFKPGKGLYVYDRPEERNPTQCIQIGGGFFRVASGKTSQGEWDFRTIGTGRGLVADGLYAGTIEGGSNSWNLSTGDLVFRQGSIRSKNGLSEWNLSTNSFRTSGMTANSITASGTFECGSTSSYGIKLNSSGQLSGFRQGAQVGYIDYSAASRHIETGEIRYGLQLQAQGIVRISTPQVATAASSSTGDTATIAATGDIWVAGWEGSPGDGWDISTARAYQLKFINGFCVSGNVRSLSERG